MLVPHMLVPTFFTTSTVPTLRCNSDPTQNWNFTLTVLLCCWWYIPSQTTCHTSLVIQAGGGGSFADRREPGAVGQVITSGSSKTIPNASISCMTKEKYSDTE